MTLVSCLCILGMCVACSSGTTNDDTSTGMNSTNGDSKVTDTMDELKDDMKNTADDVRDSMTSDSNTNNNGTNGGNTNGTASNSQSAN